MYSGNIGFTHNVESIIEIAEEIKENEDIIFFIIGRRLKKKELVSWVKDRNLKNCYFYHGSLRKI